MSEPNPEERRFSRVIFPGYCILLSALFYSQKTPLFQAAVGGVITGIASLFIGGAIFLLLKPFILHATPRQLREHISMYGVWYSMPLATLVLIYR